MNKQTKQALIFVAILLAILAVFQFADIGSPKTKESTITEIKQLVQDKKVSEIRVKGSKIEARVDGEVLIAYIEKSAQLSDYQITPDNVNIVVEDPDKGSLLPNLLTIFLPFLLIAGFLYFMLKSATGSNMRAMDFGRSKAQLYLGKHKISFADVAGAEEAKQELEEVVEFLRYPEKFRRLGAEIPKGVLLVGPPGTGKTLIARAVAGEAGVPFFSVSASEFVEMFVGVGASRVRDLFQKAKRNAPCIIFIDEIDAVGRQRGFGMGGGHDEREQTLNQILTEMDGFDNETNVIILAATNRADVLDKALLRPGRFDRKVTIRLPHMEDRVKIFEVHSKNKPLDKDVDLRKIAAATV